MPFRMFRRTRSRPANLDDRKEDSRMMSRLAGIFALCIAGTTAREVAGQAALQSRVVLRPDSMRFAQVLNGHATVVDYRGRRAIRLVASQKTSGGDVDMLGILGGAQFKDGEIRVDVA